MATSAGTVGMTGPRISGGGMYGYNGQQYPTMAAAMAAQNPESGSKEATTNAQQAVLGLQSAASPNANSGYTYAGGAPAPGPTAPPQQGGFQGPGGGTFTNAGAGSNYSVDTEGNASYNVTPNMLPQEAAVNSAAATAANKYAQEQAAQKAGLSDTSFAKRLALLGPIVGQQGGPSPYVQYGAGGGDQAARDAAFARAKEQAGQTALAGLKSFQGQMENRGLMGSTQESQGMGNIIGATGGAVNDFTREQLINDLNRSAQVADTQYQGNITQRGQDMQRQQALISLLNMGGSLY